MNMDCAVGGSTDHHFIDAKVEELAQRRVSELQALSAKKESSSSAAAANKESTTTAMVKFPQTTGNYAQGMARIPKDNFFEYFDIGVPVDQYKQGSKDVLLLYNRQQSFPKDYKDPETITDDSSIPYFADTDAAVEKCDFVHVILTDHSRTKNQCTAIVPNYESYHIQKWMRLGEKGLDSKQDFSLVSRGIMPNNGREQFIPPKTSTRKAHWDILLKYFDSFEKATGELKPLVEKVATPKKTVTVMVANFGQSELLVNFVCSARARGHDISSIILFATDPETKELAEGLGLVAFYDKWNYGEIPSDAASRYGDKKFTAMMMAKVMCVQMVSSLGYNILFQDVDIIWYKNPIPFFENEDDKKLQDFDLLFQDDGGHSVRYAPYSANSGFYYVRANQKTAHFFSNLLTSGDLVLETKSHQQALIALLSEHVSLFGLRVKVFSRDTDEFPGGYQFHQKTGKYMKKLFDHSVDPYIFHMSWTFNKDNKLLFFQQLGEWYVNNNKCLHKKPEELRASGMTDFIAGCCLAEPSFECHYSDKPSKFPCKDSPTIDKGGKPFWKDGEFKGAPK